MYARERSLNGTWTLVVAEHGQVRRHSEPLCTESALQAAGFLKLNGSVPGNFELDLQAAGLLDDPFFGTNPLKLQELENRHLWYVRRFGFGGDASRAFLRFEGIDTISEIYLNGRLLGTTDNMFLAHEFFAEGIRAGENELVVHIKPVCIEARALETDADVFVHNPYNAGSLMVRKAAHSFGWDIFPRCISGGLWRGCSIVEKKKDYLQDIYLTTVTLSEGGAGLHCIYETVLDGDFSQDYSLRLTGVCGESRFDYCLDKLWHNRGCFHFSLKNPQLWWPRDLGEPALYDVCATLSYRGEVVDERRFAFGVRTVRLVRTDTTDAQGSGEFCFFVNGEKTYIRGTNWVPLDTFHSRDAERLDKALALLWESNCNMVRCWGGGVYEDHAFFDFCDRHGILVWQDFAMGCATYPQNEKFQREIAHEVETIVKKLRRHPSIALWAGDNECDVAAAYWEIVSGDPNENRITRVTIPEVLRRVDPWRDFLPSSPYVSRAVYASGDPNRMPEDHLWGPRGYYKGEYYVNSNAHFVSEMGAFGCPSVESLRLFISPENLSNRGHDEWKLHTGMMETGEDRPYAFRPYLNDKQVAELFGTVPETPVDFSKASQYFQAEGFKFFIEHFRTEKWRRTGLIWWNLLDGWPEITEASVDYYFRKKLCFDYIRRSQEPLCLMLREPKNGALQIVAANEFRAEKCASYAVTDIETGVCLASGETALHANALTELGAIPFDPQGNHYYLLKLVCEGKTYRNHYVSGEIPFSLTQYETLLKKANIL